MKSAGNSFLHIKKYYDRVNHCDTAKILPGEFYVTDRPEMITTVLGSCVSACIYDPVSGRGGMNHFMLPGNGSANDSDGSTRYGLFAMESLVNEILKRGSLKQRLRAKLFGGGQIIENMSDIGHKNIRFARRFLFAEGIPLESHDLGLVFPRKVNFFPANGRVLVKRLQRLRNDTIGQREKEYLQSLHNCPASGAIELF